MQNLTTGDLGTLENSFDFLEDLPSGDVWNVEFHKDGDIDNFYFKDKENARAKFNELVKRYDLTIKGNSFYAKNDYASVWMGKLTFDD